MEKAKVTVEGSPEKALTAEERKSLLKSSAATVMAMVEALGIAIKSHVQSTEQLEIKIAETAFAALKHAHDHGDVMPMDRIVKDLNIHPTTRTLMQEVISWVRANSPIWWDAKGLPHQAKEGEPNYKPYNEEGAEKESFFRRPAAVRAREAANAAHENALKPYTLKSFIGRLHGLRKAYDSAKEPNAQGDIRGIARGEDKKIREFLKTVETAAVQFEAPKPEEQAA